MLNPGEPATLNEVTVVNKPLRGPNVSVDTQAYASVPSTCAVIIVEERLVLVLISIGDAKTGSGIEKMVGGEEHPAPLTFKWLLTEVSICNQILTDALEPSSSEYPTMIENS